MRSVIVIQERHLLPVAERRTVGMKRLGSLN